MRERDRERHQLFGLVAGEAEHHPLVAGAAGVDPLRDVARLAADRIEHAARIRVKADTCLGVADALDGLAYHFAQVDPRRRGDLAEDGGEAGGHHRLARHPRQRVFAQHLVEDRIGDGIRHLVGVTFGDGFGGEQVTFGHGSTRCFWREDATSPSGDDGVSRMGKGGRTTITTRIGARQPMGEFTSAPANPGHERERLHSVAVSASRRDAR